MKSRAIDRWIEWFLEQRPARANSLIITIYGDFIAAHGGTVWLGSLIRLVEPLGMNERLVRTSVYRLSQENWLASEQIGRRSYYSLTASGRRRVEHAHRRIYNAPPEAWSGEWQLVIMPAGLNGSRREGLRRELIWAGYGTMAPGVFGHPAADHDELHDILQFAGAEDKVVLLHAQNSGTQPSRVLRELARSCWDLEAIAGEYRNFIARFRPIRRALSSAGSLDPRQCFLVRTLLMHDFRRVLLHDPQLPRQLLPEDWTGGAARELCRELYGITWRAAEQHLATVCETADGGPLPPAGADFYARFGGLRRTERSGAPASAGS